MVMVNQTPHPGATHWPHSCQQLAKKAPLGALRNRLHLFSLFISASETRLPAPSHTAAQALDPHVSCAGARLGLGLSLCMYRFWVHEESGILSWGLRGNTPLPPAPGLCLLGENITAHTLVGSGQRDWPVHLACSWAGRGLWGLLGPRGSPSRAGTVGWIQGGMLGPCPNPVAWQPGVELKLNSALKVTSKWFHLAQQKVN